MKRHEFEPLLKVCGRIIGRDRVVMVVSQAVLGTVEILRERLALTALSVERSALCEGRITRILRALDPASVPVPP